MKKKITDLKNLENKKVIVRVDFNVPVINGEITDDNRIREALPTINYLLEHRAKVILLSHLGRIKTESDKKDKSLRVVFQRLKELVDCEVHFIPFTRGEKVEDSISNMKNGEIVMLENTRFEDLNNNAESKNDVNLGKYWASLGDVFVNDAFGTAHRTHASNVGIASYIKESAIGFLIEKEIKFLGIAINNPKRPFIALLGGAKVSDKINIIESLLQKADKVIIGTAMCYTFLLAMGKNVGTSLVEPEKVNLAKSLLAKYKDKLVIAVDFVISSEYKDIKGEIVDEIPNGMMGLDIGPKTINLVKKELEGAKTVIWNGPFGVTEFENYKHGSEEIAKSLVSLKEATVIIGGGDSAAMAIRMGLKNKISHISTGGGASMEFLEGKELPGISVIQERDN